MSLLNLGGTNCSIDASGATLTGNAQLHFGKLTTCNVGLQNMQLLGPMGTNPATYSSKSLQNLWRPHNRNSLGRLQNLNEGFTMFDPYSLYPVSGVHTGHQGLQNLNTPILGANPATFAPTMVDGHLKFASL